MNPLKAITTWVLYMVVLLATTPFTGLKVQQVDDKVVSDKDMKVVDFEEMSYPTLGRTARIQGVVVVRVDLDSHGKVLEAVAISGAQAFIPECLANAKKWQFEPNAQKAAVIVYNFRLSDGISKSGCDHFMLEPPNLATITTCPIQIR